MLQQMHEVFGKISQRLLCSSRLGLEPSSWVQDWSSGSASEARAIAVSVFSVIASQHNGLNTVDSSFLATAQLKPKYQETPEGKYYPELEFLLTGNLYQWVLGTQQAALFVS